MEVRGNPTEPRGLYTVAECLAEFRRGMDDRINRHIKDYCRGSWSDGFPMIFATAWRIALPTLGSDDYDTDTRLNV